MDECVEEGDSDDDENIINSKEEQKITYHIEKRHTNFLHEWIFSEIINSTNFCKYFKTVH